MNRYKRIVFSFTIGALLLLGLFLLLDEAPRMARAASSDLFVTTDGGGDCSQSDPCGLQTALDQANSGDTIYVAQGTYTGSGGAVVTVTKGVTLYGGWDGAPSGDVVRDPETYVTTLDGEETRRVMQITGPVTVTLEGLTVANGKTISTTATGWDGAGLHARGAALTLRHTNFYSNVVDVYDYDAADSYAYGGGVCVEDGTLQVYTSTFRANSAWARRSSQGGGLAISGTLTATVMGSSFQANDAWHASGLYFLGQTGGHTPFLLSGSTFVDNGQGHSSGVARGGYAGAVEVINAQAHIDRNVFRASRASNDYGAVYVLLSDLAFRRNFITGNQSGRISGLYLDRVSPFTVTNNIIADNQSRYTVRPRPAVRVRDGNGRLLHNTVAQNESSYGFQIDSGAVVTLTNTLLFSHTVGITVTEGSTAALYSTLFYTHSDGETGGAGHIVNTNPITGQDPLLDADYHLQPGSPAIDVGTTIPWLITDIDGDTRPIDGDKDGTATVDIGADELLYGWRIYLPLVLR